MSDTQAKNYGPLAQLIGTWEGTSGMDIAPDPDGTEENPYFETITFEGADDLSNAEQQDLAVLWYRQQVRRKSDGLVFHDQTGYWTWDASDGGIVHSFVIPRSVAVVAGGSYDGQPEGPGVFTVSSDLEGGAWGISQSAFMLEKARTTSFQLQLEVESDRLGYKQTTMVDIYGESFEHTDENVLQRVPGLTNA